MKPFRGVSLFLAATAIVSCGFAACDSKPKVNIQCEAFNGETLDLTPDAYREYLSLTNENDMAKLLWEHNVSRNFLPVIASKSVTFNWESDVPVSLYTFTLSTTEDFSNVVLSKETDGNFCVVEHLVPGTYYWKVSDGQGNETAVDTFTVSDYVRSMSVGGIRNFRDLGGWKTESGKKIKYGLTYRCAALRENSGSALSDLGVQTELDLRAGDEYTRTVLAPAYGISFAQAGIMQGDYVLKDKSFYSMLTPEQIEEKRHSEAAFQQEYADALYNAFKLYTDKINYPIVFHCTSGADRTGTFAFLLAGMLGVEADDLYRDFELTCFSMGGKRWRSNIEQDESGNYFFNDDGYVTVSDNYVAIGLLYKGLMTCYSTGDGKLSSAIKNYLRTDVGLTDEDFQKIENIMLE